MPTSPELHISKRLQAILPPLTDDERAQLRANILRDGEITDPIMYWHDGKRNVVLDGMNRFDIARGEGLPYSAKPISLGDSFTIGNSYEDAEVWILDRQLGRRNLLSPQGIRKIRGELYNRLKGQQGGDRKSQESKCQNDTLIGDKAQKVAEKAGVSPETVKRDGARIEALNKCISALQKGINSGKFKATDAQIKALAKTPHEKQNAVAKAARSGTPLETAMAEQKIGTPKPPPKPKPKKPPKKLDKKGYYQEWTRAIGPLVRLVDKIANGVGEKNGESHKVILGQLDACTEEMQEWMQVK